MTDTLPPISHQIWDKKYRFKEFDGTPIDQSMDDTWRRVAKALASVEKDADLWERRFFATMNKGYFSPAGRIISGAGTGRSVTLSNCLAAETLILTGEYGLVPIGETAGEFVTVLDGDGNWVQAQVRAFGLQSVASVTLRGGYLGRERKTIRATAGHRWILPCGECRTDELLTGMVLKSVKRKDVAHTNDYIAGLQHGIIYGDGSQRPKGETYLRLCGDKTELNNYFSDDWTVGALQGGDTTLYLGRSSASVAMKQLPENVSVEYMTGFLRGWLATDGCVDGSRSSVSLACGIDEAEWLKQHGAISGLEVSCAVKLSDETNYGIRNKSIFNVNIRRWVMIREDFIREKHRDRFSEVEYPWVVESISQFSEPESVYCPEVKTTGSFQLDLGIHTGNCFTMGTIPDSMNGIFTHLKEAALTMQQGGGIGYDFSTLRPKGAEVKGVAADASGPLTFMDVWDAMCRTVMSAGSRRGAMMATMRCDHPDIEAFIEAKRDPAKLRMFNLSVLVTDAFMKAVKNDEPWRLHFEDRHGVTLVERTIQARDLWRRIMENTYAFAEPGVIFIDRANADHNISYLETIATTNPCAEKPMGPYASCLLGSVNLAKFVEKPFTAETNFNFDKLRECVSRAIRLMDNVVDVGDFPLPQQKEKALQDRQLGLGVTGLADALIMCGIVYGSDEAVAWTEQVMAEIALQAYSTSVDLAVEKGSFPTFDAEKFLSGDHFANRMLTTPLKVRIRNFGLRNALLVSIAPTGTISLLAGNVSSGIEPVFALSYDRKVLQLDGSKITERVEDYAVARYRELHPDRGEMLPDYFVTAQTLPPEAHLKMQAAAQKWVDSSISKTINLPEDISFEAFQQVYLDAYDMGCKGCTTYRPNDVTGSVLSVAPEVNKAAPVTKQVEPTLTERPATLTGETIKIKWPGNEHAMYVTINDIVENGERRPFEVFINSKNMEHFAWTVALTRMISAVFRRPHDSRFVAEELKAVFDPKGGAWVGGKYVPSVLAAIGGVIERHMIAIGYIADMRPAMVDDGGHVIEVVNAPGGMVSEPRKGDEMCPKCFSGNVKHEAGCFQCIDCGHSKCG